LTILLSAVSFIVAVIRVLEAPSATMLEEPALNETEPTVAATSVILTVSEVPLVAWAVIVSVPAVIETV